MNAQPVDYPSGPWVGFYQEAGRRCRQDLELTFRDGVLAGGGWDGIGEFTVRGSYEPSTSEVRWTKRYSSHAVNYRGFREGKGIWGTWEIPGHGRSGFHIWPLAAGESLADLEAAAATPPAAVAPAPSHGRAD